MKEYNTKPKNCQIITHNLPSKMNRLLKEKENNRAKTIRDTIKRFMGNGGKVLFEVFSENTKLDITTFNCCEIIKDYLTTLNEMHIFPSRSEAIRFIVLYDLLTNEEEEVEKEEPYEPVVIRKLDTYNFKSHKEIKNKIILDPRELYVNLVVSFLNEYPEIDCNKIAELMGLNYVSIPGILHNIRKLFPNLLLKKNFKRRWLYYLDKAVLNELLERGKK